MSSRNKTVFGFGALSFLLLSLWGEREARAENPRTQAEAALRELEAQPDRALTRPLLDKAKHALSRARNARQAGDHKRGSLLETLALELTETARDLIRIKAAERQTSELEKQALEAETRVVRARALVELAAARRGRAQERLEQVEAARTATRGAEKPARGKP